MAKSSMGGDSKPAVGINVQDELFHSCSPARTMMLVELRPFIQYYSPFKKHTNECRPAGMDLDKTAEILFGYPVVMLLLLNPLDVPPSMLMPAALLCLEVTVLIRVLTNSMSVTAMNDLTRDAVRCRVLDPIGPTKLRNSVSQAPCFKVPLLFPNLTATPRAVSRGQSSRQ